MPNNRKQAIHRKMMAAEEESRDMQRVHRESGMRKDRKEETEEAAKRYKSATKRAAMLRKKLKEPRARMKKKK